MNKKQKKIDPDISFARYTTLILVLINSYQPISFDNIKTAVASKINDSDLEKCISYLIHEGLIKSLPKKEYRATWKGINSLWSRRLRHDRDIQRMSYLSEVARGD